MEHHQQQVGHTIQEVTAVVTAGLLSAVKPGISKWHIHVLLCTGALVSCPYHAGSPPLLYTSYTKHIRIYTCDRFLLTSLGASALSDTLYLVVGNKICEIVVPRTSSIFGVLLCFV